MKRSAALGPDDLEHIASDFALPPRDQAHAPAWRAAAQKVRADVASARRSGALVTPTFFINGRRYDGP